MGGAGGACQPEHAQPKNRVVMACVLRAPASAPRYRARPSPARWGMCSRGESDPMGYQPPQPPPQQPYQQQAYQPQPPRLLPTKIEGGQAPGLTYHVQGELVPVLSLFLDGTMPVFFEHHVVLWMSPQLTIGLKTLQGAFR